MVRKERGGELAGQESRQRDQAVGTLLQPALREDGATPVLISEPGTRQQRAKPEVTRARGAQQKHPGRLFPVGLVLNPAVGADDRLHAGAARSAVELDHAEKVRGIGQCERGHVIGRGAPDRVVDPDYAVAHRVLAMHPQVNEMRPCHVKKFYPERPP